MAIPFRLPWEHRRSRRVGLDLPVLVRCVGTLEFGFGTGLVLEASGTGVRIHAPMMLNPQQWIRLHPNGGGPGIRAQVVWSRCTGRAFGMSEPLSSIAGCRLESPKDSTALFGLSGSDPASRAFAFWAVAILVALGAAMAIRLLV